MKKRNSDFKVSEAGFTMVEFIMIMVIMAILSVMVMTRTLQPSEYQARGAAQKMVADIQYVQALAMSTATRCGINFNMGGNSYTLFSGSPATPLTDPVQRTDYTVQYGTGFYSNVHLSTVNIGGTTTLYFDSRGRPYNASGTALAADGLVVLNGATNITIARETGFTTST